jgi:hypothetical protein
MSIEKKLNTRQKQKNDISARWTEAGNKGFCPLEGEIIVYSDLKKIKVGEKDASGNLININDLPFLSETEIDKSLTKADTAADAKAVGDALASIEYTNATEDENGIVILGKSPQSAGGSVGIDDSVVSMDSTWSSQKITDNMAADLRVRAEVVDIDPVPNTEISEVITWLKYDTVELADTVGWRDMDNWKTINQGEDESSNSWLQYLVIPTDGGIFNISGIVGSWGADVNYAYISNVNEDGTLGTNTIYSFEYDSGDGSFNVSDLEWLPGDGDAHAIAFVIDSIWPSEFLIEFSCLYNKQQYMYDSSDIWLTVVKDGVKTTYSADTPCLDWCQNMGYNWLTGQGLDEDGNVLEDYFWGNAYPELANIGKATFISNVGTVSVDYMSYPNKTITVLQNEVKELRRQVEKLIDTVAALDSNI